MARGHAPRTVYVRDSHGSRSCCQKSLKTNAVNCLWNAIAAELWSYIIGRDVVSELICMSKKGQLVLVILQATTSGEVGWKTTFSTF